MRYFYMRAVVTVIGKDMVGILAKVTAICADKNVNVLEVTQSIMQDLFAMVMLVDITKCTVQLMRDLGSIPSPMNAFLLGLGMETLALRMERHCRNALEVATFLKNHPAVTWVKYPSLEGDKYYDLTMKYMPGGSCGVVSFGVKGGRSAAERLMKNMKLTF